MSRTKVDKLLQEIYDLSFSSVPHYGLPVWDTVLIAKNAKKLAKLHKKLHKAMEEYDE